MPSTVKIACYVYNGTGFTEDTVFTSGQVLFGDTIFNIDNCKMRITHSTIEPSYDFNERKKNDTLIPGEVYNFFIHFRKYPLLFRIPGIRPKYSRAY